MAQKRLAAERTEALLSRLMDVIAAEGFASLKVSELARRLKCSTSTLYRIAPSKESLVIAAIGLWAESNLEAMKIDADAASTPSGRARRYYDLTVRSAAELSPVFRRDVTEHDSTNRVYVEVANKSIAQFAIYLDEAVRAGEIRAVDTRFLAILCRQLGLVVGNPAALESAGLTSEQAMREIESLLWEGLLPRE